MGEWEDHDISDPLEVENRNVGSCLTSSKKKVRELKRGWSIRKKNVYVYIYIYIYIYEW